MSNTPLIFQQVDHTLSTPEQNLALDEILLRQCADDSGKNVLRLWESDKPFVVLGRSSKREAEVNLEACRIAGVPILRRISGGATIITGPGCLMYALTIRLREHPEFRDIQYAHRTILDRFAKSLVATGLPVTRQGISDLVIDVGDGALRKFSGNSVRVTRDGLLYHGTLLYDFPLERIAGLLRHPPREPEYRMQRSHAGFLANLPLSGTASRSVLLSAWHPEDSEYRLPELQLEELSRARYADPRWNEEGKASNECHRW